MLLRSLICACFHSDRSLYKRKSYHALSIAIPSHAENNFGVDAKASFVNRHLFEIVLSTRRKELNSLLSSAEKSSLDCRTSLQFVVEMTLSNLALLSFLVESITLRSRVQNDSDVIKVIVAR